MKKIYTLYSSVFSFILLQAILSCDDFTKIDPPRTALVKSTVFDSDATAKAAMTDIYYQLVSNGFASGSVNSITFFTSLSSDEETSYYNSSTPVIVAEYQQFNTNSLAANNSNVLSLWSGIYKFIYKANAILEGLATSTRVSDPVKRQLAGEAKFIRAFCHFYLVNLFGDVPLVTTTDYRTNSSVPRTSAAQLYQQIITDLVDAQGLLPDDFSASTNERVRPNKGAATALLARTYLYTGDWANAEAQATSIVANTTQYGLIANLKTVVVKNSKETILQLWNASSTYPNDFNTFYVFGSPFFGALTNGFAAGFEAGDARRAQWVGVDGIYFFPTKYSSFTAGAEYSVVLRVAEQYLIRAEARAHLGNIAGAQADINVIRLRAGLGTTAAGTESALLLAVEQERRSELFTEWGHRWFDLKRTGRADAVLGPLKPQWTSIDALFPIPESEMLNNAALRNAQNPGY